MENLFEQRECVFTLEVFPPKRASGVETVYQTLDSLAGLPLDYVSVTYSAGGSGAKEYTAQIASYLKDNLGIHPLAHLTCVGASRAQVAAELAELERRGINSVLALRGDRPPDMPPVLDYQHASDLVADIQGKGGFYIAGACYPEGHPESADATSDIEGLRLKLDAGVKHLVSQLFFDNGKFFRFLNLARKKGVDCPIEAGVMPIVRKEQIQRTISLSSASLPAGFSKLVTKYEHDAEGFYEAGIEYAIHQIRDLVDGGVDGIHLYAMNSPEVARRVYEGISDLL